MADEDEHAMAEFMSVNDGNFGVPFTVLKDDSAMKQRFWASIKQSSNKFSASKPTRQIPNMRPK
ncbi:hypothetical protein IPL68_06175 [Candidatus Saccharibacteria bacterium]|nr:MAG: hypothetical protein IPL68_06175 [Candidatus Saccharibacteria bacterium]